MKQFLAVIGTLITIQLAAQQPHSHATERSLLFPDIPGYSTIKCDLHMHSVFSDGSVWPDIRVQEALRDGLDAISLTEHLEYQPHKADIPHPDRNRSYELATKEAKDHNLIIIRGSEITRRMPPGHNNAIFIQDANKLLISDSIEVFKGAKQQGAFVFWNHPNWTSQRKDGMATLTDMHRRLIREKLLDGIEVVNDVTYSDEALQIALDNNLTIMGTSDIHGLVDWQFGVPEGGHRPVTLVFGKEKTADAIRDGLFNRRTVVYFKDILIGRKEYLLPLIQNCLQISKATYNGNHTVLTVTIKNNSSCAFTLQNKSGYTFADLSDIVTVPPSDSITVEVKTVQKLDKVALSFEVLNAVFAPKSHPSLTLEGKID